MVNENMPEHLPMGADPIGPLPPSIEQFVGRRLRLVDNRIVAGVSNWIAVSQPITVCVLHPKQTKAKQRENILAALALINIALTTIELSRAPAASDTPDLALTE